MNIFKLYDEYIGEEAVEYLAVDVALVREHIPNNTHPKHTKLSADEKTVYLFESDVPDFLDALNRHRIPFEIAPQPPFKRSDMNGIRFMSPLAWVDVSPFAE